MTSSIDRAFDCALGAVQGMSTSCTRRPPQATRAKLYGLYKQATEGDMTGCEYPSGDSAQDESARRQWVAWKKEEGLEQEEAKKQYIFAMMDTIRTYGGDSMESRHALKDLERTWSQIKDVPSRPASRQASRPPSRAPSPAASLYRVVSGGFNTNVVRPASRCGDRKDYKEISNRDGCDEVFSSREVTYVDPFNQQEPTAERSSERSADFVKWQSEINISLGKLANELANMRNEKKQAKHSQDSWQLFKEHAIEFALKVYSYAKVGLRHLAADSVLLLLAYGLAQLVRGKLRQQLLKYLTRIVALLRNARQRGLLQ